MPLSESEIKLRGLLKEIRDEKNFVNGMLSGLRQCDKTDKMINFIEMAKKRGDILSADDITMLTIRFRKE